MADIYEQHDRAFQNVAAYTVSRDAQLVAKIAIKYPRDGAGRLYAYVHWFGFPMGRGWASGYGYDKASAALSVWAAKNVDPSAPADSAHRMFVEVLRPDNGRNWKHRLEAAGFSVWRAV